MKECYEVIDAFTQRLAPTLRPTYSISHDEVSEIIRMVWKYEVPRGYVEIAFEFSSPFLVTGKLNPEEDWEANIVSCFFLERGGEDAYFCYKDDGSEKFVWLDPFKDAWIRNSFFCALPFWEQNLRAVVSPPYTPNRTEQLTRFVVESVHPTSLAVPVFTPAEMLELVLAFLTGSIT